jgi:hypothetical protein
MTDGEATIGITDPNAILKNVRFEEKGYNLKIHGLAFGKDSDLATVQESIL